MLLCILHKLNAIAKLVCQQSMQMWLFQNAKCIHLGGITLGWKKESSRESHLFTIQLFHCGEWVNFRNYSSQNCTVGFSYAVHHKVATGLLEQCSQGKQMFAQVPYSAKGKYKQKCIVSLRFELCLDFSVLELDLDVEDKTAYPVLPLYGVVDVDRLILYF